MVKGLPKIKASRGEPRVRASLGRGGGGDVSKQRDKKL